MHRASIVWLLSAVLFLITTGVVVLISTCVFGSQAESGDGYHEAKRQAIWLGLGVVACVVGALIDYRFWMRHVWWMFGVTCVLLALCFVPFIGMEINGERRWIGVASFQIQPSEIAKISLIAFIAYWYSRHADCGRHFLKGFIYPLAIAGGMIGLVLMEVDIGTTAVLALTTLLLMFVAGVSWKFLSALGATGVIVFLSMLSYAPDRMQRIMAFLDLETHRYGAGFQQWISLMALGSGGVTGRGLGEGRLKMLYMPFAHTDFIFPMVGEEMGLIMTVLVVVAFVTMVVAGFTIAFHAPDRFGAFMAVGLVGYIAFQAFLNIGVTTAILPNTGLTLPFVSYGGSSLLTGCLAVGILINIYRQGGKASGETATWLRGTRYTPRV